MDDALPGSDSNPPSSAATQALRDSPSAPENSAPGLRVVTRWDLDKTYLRSDFYTFRDLLRSALERPDQKRPIPGASQLLAELGNAGARVHILSGSPEQMRKSIVARLEMDGIFADSLTLKPNLRNILKLRFFALKDQLGYKLPALLEARLDEWRRSPIPQREVLVGDDSEADPFVYSLYADILARALDLRTLERILEAGELYAVDRKRTLALAETVLARDEKDATLILIHLDRQTPPSRFASYGRRLVPFFNYAQAALVLLDRGLLSPAATSLVAADLLTQHRFDLSSLARSYWDLRRRGHLSDRALGRLQTSTLVPLVEKWPEAILRDPLDSQPARATSPPVPLDYIALARAHAGGKNRDK